MSTEINIGKNLKKYRLKKDMSQDKLARMSEVTHTTLVKIEIGINNNPTIKTLLKLADTLEVSIDELIGRKKKLK